MRQNQLVQVISLAVIQIFLIQGIGLTAESSINTNYLSPKIHIEGLKIPYLFREIIKTNQTAVSLIENTQGVQDKFADQDEEFINGTKRIPEPELTPAVGKDGELYWGLVDEKESAINNIALRSPTGEEDDKIDSYLLRKYPLTVSTAIGFRRTLMELYTKKSDSEEELILLIGFNVLQRKALKLAARKSGIEHKIRFIKQDDIRTVDRLVRFGGDSIDAEAKDVPLQVIHRPLIASNTIESAI